MIPTLLLAAALSSPSPTPERQAAPAVEQSRPDAAAQTQHGEGAPTGHGEAATGGHGEQAGGSGHGGPAEILMHHVLDQPLGIGHLDYGGLHFEPTRHLVFLVVAAALVLLVARLAIRSYREGGVPTGLGAAVEGLVLFVRDDIAIQNIGHDGRKFVPLLCSFFFFILIAALFGLLPFSATSTGNISVTMGLAVVSFAAMQYAGISKYGVVHHFTGMIPPGLPVWLVPIMIPVEIVGLFTKPMALMIRLFANMLAGHMVIAVLLMLIPIMAGINFAFGAVTIPISLGLALFVMLLEVLVAFIQAYIFTLLSAIFIGMFAHPAH
jgi:F-type H+-transporting ATPase subunit a